MIHFCTKSHGLSTVAIIWTAAARFIQCLTETGTFCKGQDALRHLRFSVIDAEDWSVAGLANSDVSKEHSVFLFWGSGPLNSSHTQDALGMCAYYVIVRREWKMGQVADGVSRAGHRRLVPLKVIT